MEIPVQRQSYAELINKSRRAGATDHNPITRLYVSPCTGGESQVRKLGTLTTLRISPAKAQKRKDKNLLFARLLRRNIYFRFYADAAKLPRAACPIETSALDRSLLLMPFPRCPL
jgi:hypothetical protein